MVNSELTDDKITAMIDTAEKLSYTIEYNKLKLNSLRRKKETEEFNKLQEIQKKYERKQDKLYDEIAKAEQKAQHAWTAENKAVAEAAKNPTGGRKRKSRRHRRRTRRRKSKKSRKSRRRRRKTRRRRR